MSNWYFGTIGFSYKDWVGPLYPVGAAQHEFLAYYCKVFKSVEIDTTFHSLPRLSAVQSWYANSPPGFIFSIKTPRSISHDLGLIGAEGLMNEFIDSIYHLKDKAGPVLIQLPPSYTQENLKALGNFLEFLPPSYRYAIEFRHRSWYNQQTAQLLSQFKICWVSIDYPNLPTKIIPTTDFLYIRWVGVNNKYHYHSYERVDKNDHLHWWLDAIKEFQTAIPTVYGYFNNDYTGFAAGTCKRFMVMAGLIDEEDNLLFQERLF
jgi:uncharacterized protein YecE (DUF72 family)